MKRWPVILVLLCCWRAWAAEVIPPAPPDYFNDYAHVTSPATASRLDRELRDFEKQTSSQLLVAIYPKMQSDSSIEDYAVRVYRAWKVGLKGKDNGAVLLVFVQDHKMNITTGYGLEGAMPDVICKRIIADEIAPHFKQGDYDGGLTAGVAAMMAAAKGEYKGTGQTVAQAKQRKQNRNSGIWTIVGIIILILIFSRRRRMGYGGGWMMGGGGFGGWSGGGGGGGGGGGFSGGGGSSGGGGASGSW